MLPSILVLGDSIINRTSFRMKSIEIPTRTVSGTVMVDGHLRGYVSGMVDAEFHGILHGEINAAVSTDTKIVEAGEELTEGSGAESGNESAAESGAEVENESTRENSAEMENVVALKMVATTAQGSESAENTERISEQPEKQEGGELDA